MTLNECREEYATIRSFACYDNATSPEFDAAARSIAGKNATPKQWVAAAFMAAFTCRRCVGTGLFITGTVNGKPSGPGGDCYRCEGRGTQTWEDGRRNRTHDMMYMARAA